MLSLGSCSTSAYLQCAATNRVSPANPWPHKPTAAAGRWEWLVWRSIQWHHGNKMVGHSLVSVLRSFRLREDIRGGQCVERCDNRQPPACSGVGKPAVGTPWPIRSDKRHSSEECYLACRFQTMEAQPSLV